MLIPKSITVEKEIWEAFGKFCESKCLSRSKIIRKWIDDFIIKNKIYVKK